MLPGLGAAAMKPFCTAWARSSSAPGEWLRKTALVLLWAPTARRAVRPRVRRRRGRRATARLRRGRARLREGVGLGAGRTVAHHVEVLRDDHEVHDGLRVHVLHLALEGVDRLTQPLHDGLPLARDALPREELGLRVRLRLDLRARRLGLGLLDRLDLDRLALVLRCAAAGVAGVGGRRGIDG